MSFDGIGNTPLLYVKQETDNEFYIKLETLNRFGSIKDRAAKYVIEKLLAEGKDLRKYGIIESTSGNMGVALAAACNYYSIPFTAVVDPMLSATDCFLIESLNAELITVQEADMNNSYLPKRLEKVKEILQKNPNMYWFNQYGNEYVVEAYRETIGKEIVSQIPELEYIFIAVSSMGTISGISQAIKNYNPDIQVIAVDIEGSIIFDPNTKKKRHIPGIGSSVISLNSTRAKIDDYIIVNEKQAIDEAKQLLSKNSLFVGGSAGCVFLGAKQYMQKHNIHGKNVVCIFADRGEKYLNTIYA